jgi:hypothetical protein
VKTVSLQATCTRATDRAILVETAAGSGWVPRKFVAETSRVQRSGDSGTLVVDAWLVAQEDKPFLRGPGAAEGRPTSNGDNRVMPSHPSAEPDAREMRDAYRAIAAAFTRAADSLEGTGKAQRRAA